MLAASERPSRVQTPPHSILQPREDLPVGLAAPVVNANTLKPSNQRLPGYDRKTRRLEWVAFLVIAKLALAAIVVAVVHPFNFAGGTEGGIAALSPEPKALAHESSGQEPNVPLAKPLTVKATNPAGASRPRCCVTLNSPCA